MADKKCIVLLALLGDPEVPAGIPETGGFNKTVSELLNYFIDTDINITVITNKNKYNDRDSIVSDNINICRIDFKAEWQTDQNLLVANMAQITHSVTEILDTLKKGADISLLHSFYWLSGYVAAQIENIPFIHTVVSLSEDKYAAGVKPHADLQRDLESGFLSMADLIYAITPQEKNTLTIKYGIDSKKIQVVGRSINPCFKEAYLNAQRLQSLDERLSDIDLSDDYSWWESGAFLYVGRIVEIKGIKQIISAWIMAKDTYNIDIPLWLVGGTPKQIQKMRQLIRSSQPCIQEYEKSKQLIWWGNLNSNAICVLMRKCQALIMHSCFEAGGRVIIEAFSAGVPVIATPYGFGGDYIYNKYNGFLTKFDDIKKLAEIMAQFSEQPYLSSVMGRNASNFVNTICQKWNYEKQHYDVYNSYLHNTKLPKLSEISITPDDLNSFKSRNSVTEFPYFNTELSVDLLSDIIRKKLGEHSIKPIQGDNLHSDFYYIQYNGSNFYLRCFYSILTDRLSKLQYKNQNVISAKEQAEKYIASTKFNNIAFIEFGDPSYLLCLAPEYTCKTGSLRMSILVPLWKEAIPPKNIKELWVSQDFVQLKKQIDNSDDPMLNYLFCSELAYEKLFSKRKLPDNIDRIVNKLMRRKKQAVFGLNYGKGIQGHVLSDGRFLPTHSVYIGELGIDVVLTFFQHGEDDPALWKKLKGSQDIICPERLDLWLLIIIFAMGKEKNYPNLIDVLSQQYL